MYDMRVYFGRDSHSATDDMTVLNITVRHLTCRVKDLRHKIFVDNFFSSPRLFYDLDRHKINSCGTVRSNRKDMPRDFGRKQQKLKRGDVRVGTRGGLTGLIWKNRREGYVLTNMNPALAEGNFCDYCNCPMKPNIVEQYNRHVGYIDSSDHMASGYLMSQRTSKWTTKLFVHLLDLTVLNSWIPLFSCGAKYTN